jgi:hypothetical protein
MTSTPVKCTQQLQCYRHGLQFQLLQEWDLAQLQNMRVNYSAQSGESCAPVDAER